MLAHGVTWQRFLAITRWLPPIKVEPFGEVMETILTVAAKHASHQSRQDADAGEQRGVMVAGHALPAMTVSSTKGQAVTRNG